MGKEGCQWALSETGGGRAGQGTTKMLLGTNIKYPYSAALEQRPEQMQINLEKRGQQARNVSPTCENAWIQQKDLGDNRGISLFQTAVIRVPQDQAQNLISAGPKQPRAPVSIKSWLQATL